MLEFLYIERLAIKDLKTPCSACIQKLLPRIHKKSKAVKWD